MLPKYSITYVCSTIHRIITILWMSQILIASVSGNHITLSIMVILIAGRGLMTCGRMLVAFEAVPYSPLCGGKRCNYCRKISITNRAFSRMFTLCLQSDDNKLGLDLLGLSINLLFETSVSLTCYSYNIFMLYWVSVPTYTSS